MTDEPTIRIRDGSLVTREEYDKSEQYVQEVQKAKANRQVKPDSSLDMTELSSRLRLLQRYHGDNDAGEAADALEQQARLIVELRKEADMMHSEYKTARDRIAELEDKLKDEEYVSKDTNEMFHEVRDENIELRARIAELEAALKPFADISYVLEETDSGTIYEWALDCDDLRAAHAALEKKNEGL